MLDLTPIVDLIGILTTDNTFFRYMGKNAYVAFYSAPAAFTCYTEIGNVVLTPLVLRLTYDRDISGGGIMSGGVLRSASITCSTSQAVSAIAGSPVSLYSDDFEIYGRIRRSKCDRFYRQFTGVSQIALAIYSILSINQCKYCTTRPKGKTCESASCKFAKKDIKLGKT